MRSFAKRAACLNLMCHDAYSHMHPPIFNLGKASLLFQIFSSLLNISLFFFPFFSSYDLAFPGEKSAFYFLLVRVA